MRRIHPTAVVSSNAELGEDVVVGPYAVIDGPALIGPGVRVGPHAVVRGWVRLAEGVQIDAHAMVGGDPQDLSYGGQETWLEVGRNTVIREAAILHRSTTGERPTRVGSGCYLMGHSHVAHDCQLGDQVVLTQGAGLAGHVTVGTGAVIGGMAGVHQHVRIGRQAMVGGMALVLRDVLPFAVADGQPARHRGVNTVGLQRDGVGAEDCRALREAFDGLRERRILDDVLPGNSMVAEMAAFLAAPSRRGISGFHPSNVQSAIAR